MLNANISSTHRGLSMNNSSCMKKSGAVALQPKTTTIHTTTSLVLQDGVARPEVNPPHSIAMFEHVPHHHHHFRQQLYAPPPLSTVTAKEDAPSDACEARGIGSPSAFEWATAGFGSHSWRQQQQHNHRHQQAARSIGHHDNYLYPFPPPMMASHYHPFPSPAVMAMEDTLAAAACEGKLKDIEDDLAKKNYDLNLLYDEFGKQEVVLAQQKLQLFQDNHIIPFEDEIYARERAIADHQARIAVCKGELERNQGIHQTLGTKVSCAVRNKQKIDKRITRTREQISLLAEEKVDVQEQLEHYQTAN